MRTNMKKAFLIHYDGYYDIRLKYLEKNLVDRGYEVSLLFSDFDHYKKERKIYRNKNIKLLLIFYYLNHTYIDIKKIFL